MQLKNVQLCSIKTHVCCLWIIFICCPVVGCRLTLQRFCSQSSVQNVKHRRHSNYVRVLKIAILLFYFTSIIITMYLVVIGNSLVLMRFKRNRSGEYFLQCSADRSKCQYNQHTKRYSCNAASIICLCGLYATVHFYALAPHYYSCRYKYTNG